MNPGDRPFIWHPRGRWPGGVRARAWPAASDRMDRAGAPDGHPGWGGRRVHGGGEAAQGPARAVDGQGQWRHLGALVGELAALPGVLVADAEVVRRFSHAERLQHRAPRIAQRDDQVPGERGIVQPVVDQREVGRLAPVTVKRGTSRVISRPSPRPRRVGTNRPTLYSARCWPASTISRALPTQCPSCSADQGYTPGSGCAAFSRPAARCAYGRGGRPTPAARRSRSYLPRLGQSGTRAGRRCQTPEPRAR